MKAYCVLITGVSSKWPDSHWISKAAAENRVRVLLETFKAYGVGFGVTIREFEIEDATPAEASK